MVPLYKGHIGTLETVLYIEVVLIQWNLKMSFYIAVGLKTGMFDSIL